MFVASVSLITLFAFFQTASSADDSLTLDMVALIHRHGDRTPLFFSPKDPYSNDKYWPDGKSQLLAEGKERLYRFGQSLRRYYSNFLTNSPREVYARSSDADRCIESAQVLFHGLYKAKDRWKYSTETDYLPVPIHTTPKKYDKMLVEGVYCPVLNKELDRVLKTSEAQAVLKKYCQTVSTLSNHYGFSIDSLESILGLYDAIYIESTQNYTTPKWITSQILSDMSDMVNAYATFQNDSPLIHRLRSGPFLNDLRSQFNSKITQNPFMKNNHKLVTYSTHDTMLGAYLAALGVFNGIRVPYGATLLIELLTSKSTNQHYVQMKYWNDTSRYEQHILKPVYCLNANGLCTVDEFFNHLKTLIPDNWDSECQKVQSSTDFENNKEEETTAWTFIGVTLVTCLSFLTLIVVIFILFFAIKMVKKTHIVRSEREKEEYSRIL